MNEELTPQKERFLQEVEQKLLRKELDAKLLEDGVCLAVSSIPFQHQRRVTLQRADGNHIVFCVEKNKRLSVGQTYRVYLPTGTVVSEVKKAHLPQHYALTVEKIEIDSICIVPDASEKPVEKSQQKPYN